MSINVHFGVCYVHDFPTFIPLIDVLPLVITAEHVTSVMVVILFVRLSATLKSQEQRL